MHANDRRDPTRSIAVRTRGRLPVLRRRPNPSRGHSGSKAPAQRTSGGPGGPAPAVDIVEIRNSSTRRPARYEIGRELLRKTPYVDGVEIDYAHGRRSVRRSVR